MLCYTRRRRDQLPMLGLLTLMSGGGAAGPVLTRDGDLVVEAMSLVMVTMVVMVIPRLRCLTGHTNNPSPATTGGRC